jgi:hypothetical protein
MERGGDEEAASMVRTWWSVRGAMILRPAVVLMASFASLWLAYEFWRLLWGEAPIWRTSPTGAVDLKILHDLVHRWFAGEPVYGEMRSAIHPPATYALLWPFLGWLEVTPARYLWGATTVGMLAWLAYLVVRESGADTPVERALMAVLPLSMYPTGATIGNGQLIVHLLPMLVAGLLLLCRRPCGLGGDLIGAALVLFTLVKPSVTVPFFWIVLLVPGRLRPAILVAAGYGVLTLFAVSYRSEGPFALFRSWVARSSAAAVRSGYANLHIWLATLGLGQWILLSSFLALVALGIWTYRHRRRDPWILMGVAALVARFWTYHAWYDDLLILLPMVALFRVAKRGTLADGGDVVAGVLLAITTLVMLAPGGLFLFPPPWKMLYVAAVVTTWIGILIFLLDRAWRESRTGVAG